MVDFDQFLVHYHNLDAFNPFLPAHAYRSSSSGFQSYSVAITSLLYNHFAQPQT